MFRTLAETGLTPQLERYRSTVYVVVNPSRPDIVALALASGRSVRRVHDLDELQSQELQSQQLQSDGHRSTETDQLGVPR